MSVILDKDNKTNVTPMIFINKQNMIVTTFAIILVVLFTILSILQISNWTPLDNIRAYEDIQTNFNKWYNIIVDYQKVQSSHINGLIPYMKNYTNFTCIDYGSFYLPLNFSSYNFNDVNLLLPTAIRRGNGDGWMIQKSSNVDPAAYQQCLYLMSEMSDNTITCGIDMYNKLGYSGYLNQNHWCNDAHTFLYNVYN